MGAGMAADLQITDWKEWIDFCQFYDEDPREISDYGFDLGGGDSFDIEFIGEIPKEEEDA